jgi:DNA-binding protein H-NS
MARTASLTSMSVEALLKLRDDIGKVLSQKAAQLKDQLSKLGAEVSTTRPGRRGSLKGRKVAIKYRDKEGNTWAGRGAQPVWLREKLSAGAKLEDFAVEQTVASRKVSAKKAKRRRKK